MADRLMNNFSVLVHFGVVDKYTESAHKASNLLHFILLDECLGTGLKVCYCF